MDQNTKDIEKEHKKLSKSFIQYFVPNIYETLFFDKKEIIEKHLKDFDFRTVEQFIEEVFKLNINYIEAMVKDDSMNNLVALALSSFNQSTQSLGDSSDDTEENMDDFEAFTTILIVEYIRFITSQPEMDAKILNILKEYISRVYSLLELRYRTEIIDFKSYKNRLLESFSFRLEELGNEKIFDFDYKKMQRLQSNLEQEGYLAPNSNFFYVLNSYPASIDNNEKFKWLKTERSLYVLIRELIKEKDYKFGKSVGEIAVETALIKDSKSNNFKTFRNNYNKLSALISENTEYLKNNHKEVIDIVRFS